ncbi:hypothetical protein EJ06DRAFT_519002 [Trichodelitschia bisporula]|uniref:Uncharacterized protein n=1 Tax=Trichodelitschia bisporula TaxID=703511 RepID=A0A6G1I8K2_9PEZI|nr:hypothetical protein EJ06DRAFT_519002 [Trichodelitschia bisporula]
MLNAFSPVSNLDIVKKNGKIDFASISHVFGPPATYDAVEGFFRKVKVLAKAIESGQASSCSFQPSSARWPRHQKEVKKTTPKKESKAGRVVKKPSPKKPSPQKISTFRTGFDTSF